MRKRSNLVVLLVILVVFMCACQAPYSDIRYDDPDYTYLLNEPDDELNEFVGYKTAWTHYKGENLDTRYVISPDVNPENISVNFKYVYSYVREESATPFESWYIIQQSGLCKLKFIDTLVIDYFKVNSDTQFVEDTNSNNIVTKYWITSDPSKPDTCVVRLQSSEEFLPTDVILRIGLVRSNNYIQYVFESQPIDCVIDTNLGYKSTGQPISLVQLGGKYYITSSSLSNKKVTKRAIQFSNITVIPIDGTYVEFTSNMQKHFKAGLGNTFIMSDKSRCYEYIEKLNLNKNLVIKVSADSDAYEWENEIPFTLNIQLKSKTKPLKKLLNNDFVPAIYTCTDDYGNNIPVVIDAIYAKK